MIMHLYYGDQTNQDIYFIISKEEDVRSQLVVKLKAACLHYQEF